MKRDFRKRVHGVLRGQQDGVEHVVLVLENGLTLSGDRKGLSKPDADVYGEGIKAGLGLATPAMIRRYKRGAFKVTDIAPALPQATDPFHVDLFQEGIAKGIKIAAEGYWLDERG